MRFESLVIITVERMSEQVLMELSKRQKYLRPDHLPRHRPKKVVDPSDPSLHWMSNNNEWNWFARGGKKHTKKREPVSWCGAGNKPLEFTNLSIQRVSVWTESCPGT